MSSGRGGAVVRGRHGLPTQVPDCGVGSGVLILAITPRRRNAGAARLVGFTTIDLGKSVNFLASKPSADSIHHGRAGQVFVLRRGPGSPPAGTSGGDVPGIRPVREAWGLVMGPGHSVCAFDIRGSSSPFVFAIPRINARQSASPRLRRTGTGMDDQTATTGQ